MVVKARYAYDDNCVAVIGMAARLPGAETLEEFWRNLMEGRVCRERVTEEVLARSGYSDLRSHPGYVPYRYSIGGYELFDAEFFGMPTREASLTDPQHRLVLEYAVRAFEHAGYPPRDTPGVRTGVFASADISRYLIAHLHPYFVNGVIDVIETYVGNDKDYLATRIAYKQNFTGPAMNVQCACSSSLASLHTAVLSILGGDCDRAIVTSSTVMLPDIGYVYAVGGMHSPDGFCRPYDADAQGVVFSNGVAAVLLKRLPQALEDGDTVWAVIRGSASCNDGKEKIGFVAPSAEGQARTIRAALEISGVDPADVAYIEGHGTGTSLGDPIEIIALLDAYGTVKDRPILLGSVKGNIGHLDATAGLGSFIKACLCLHHGASPGTANFRRLNPAFGDIRPLEVSSAAGPLPRREGVPLLAAVSAFGFGGTNVHVILQEGPRPVFRETSEGSRLLLFSSPYKETMAKQRGQLRDFFEQSCGPPLEDAAFTLAAGRTHYRWRSMVVARSREEAAGLLARPDLPLREADEEEGGVAFLFPGQGNLHALAGAAFAEHDAGFRDSLAEADALIRDAGGPDIRALMADCRKNPVRAEEKLAMTGTAQPLLFALETAFAATLEDRGIQPSCLVGHSLGEYAAAVTAGVFSLSDAARLIVCRSQLMQAALPGKMLLVTLGRDRLPEVLGEAYARVELSVINGPANCVLTGSDRDLEQCERLVEAAGQRAFTLRTSHAFHSASMQPVLEPFRRVVAEVRLSPPRIPLASNLTGGWAGEEMATPDYWVRHLRHPVEFERCLALIAEITSLGLEVGPGNVMRTLAARPGGKFRVVSGLDSPVPLPCPEDASPPLPPRSLNEVAGELWMQGGSIDWEAFYGNNRPLRCPMPGVVLRPYRCWVDKPATETPAAGLPVSLTLPVEKRDRAVSDDHAAPETDTERTLADIWQELLLVCPIGRHDHFLELGGNSIQIIQMIRMAEAKGLRITVKDVFEGKTVAGLVAGIGEAVSGSAKSAGEIAVPDFLSAWKPGGSPFLRYRVFAVPSGFETGKLKTLAMHLSRRHDALRLRWEDGSVRLHGALSSEQAEVFALGLGTKASRIDASGLLEGDPGPCLASLPTLDRDSPWSLAVLPSRQDGVELLLVRFAFSVTDEAGMDFLTRDIGAFLAGEPQEEAALWQRWPSLLPQGFLGPPQSQEARFGGFFTARDGGGNKDAHARARRYRIQGGKLMIQLQQAARACRISVGDAALSAFLSFLAGLPEKQLLLQTWKDARGDLPALDPLAKAVGVIGYPITIPVPEVSPVAEEAIPTAKNLVYRATAGTSGTPPWQGADKVDLSFSWRDPCPEHAAGPEDAPGRLREFARGVWPTIGGRTGETVFSAWLEGDAVRLEVSGPEKDWEGTLEKDFGRILRDVAACGARSERSSRYLPADFPGRGLSQKDIDRILARIAGGSDTRKTA